MDAKRTITVQDGKGNTIAEVSKSRAAKMVERQKRMERTQLVVCHYCWQNGTGQYKKTAHLGTMKANKETGRYEHLEFCEGRKEATSGS